MQKNLDIVYNHALLLFIDKQIEFMLFFVEIVFPKGAHVRVSLIVILVVEIFKHIGHGSPFFVSSLGILILKFTLQHHMK